MRTTTPTSHSVPSRNGGHVFSWSNHRLRLQTRFPGGSGIARWVEMGIRGGGPLVCMLCSSAAALNAQGIIGKVLNEGAGAVVAAEVQLLDAKGNIRARSVTDTAGLFRLVAPVPGRYSIRASSIGYATTNTSEVQLDKGIELKTEVRLSTSPVPVQPLNIVAERKYRVGRLGEYYDRADWARKTGFGRVLMRDDLERMAGVRTTSLMQMYPPRAGCTPTVLVDGLEVHPDEFDRRRGFSSLDSIIPSDQIEGIEFYRGGVEMPVEYASRAGCGLVMIWTRRDVPNGRPFGWKRALITAGLVGGLILLTR